MATDDNTDNGTIVSATMAIDDNTGNGNIVSATMAIDDDIDNGNHVSATMAIDDNTGNIVGTFDSILALIDKDNHKDDNNDQNCDDNNDNNVDDTKMPATVGRSTDTASCVPLLRDLAVLNDLAAMPDYGQNALIHSTVQQHNSSWLVYRQTDPLLVLVSVSEMRKLLDISEDGLVHFKCFAKGLLAERFRVLLHGHRDFPAHIDLTFDQPLDYVNKVKNPKSRRLKGVADLVLGRQGYCGAAAACNCPTKFAVGWDQVELEQYVSYVQSGFSCDDEKLPMKCLFFQKERKHMAGDVISVLDSVVPIDATTGCVHRIGNRYGKLCGSERKFIAQKMIDQRIVGSQFQRDNGSALTTNQFHSDNARHKPSRTALKNVRSQGRRHDYEQYHLPPIQNSIEGMLIAMKQTRDIDQERRKKINDPCTDLLGFFSPFVIHPDMLEIIMTTRDQMKQYRVLASVGYGVVHFDGTGAVTRLRKVHGNSGSNPIQHHMLHASTKYAVCKMAPELRNKRTVSEITFIILRCSLITIVSFFQLPDQRPTTADSST